MGRDLYDNFAEARQVFDAADEALGAKLSRLCFEGPEEALTDTINAQPAILVHSLASLAAMKSVLGTSLANPQFSAGHSLGEYSALAAGNAFEFTDAIRLVRSRGVAMKRAGEMRPGAMAAILGLEESQVERLCSEAGAVQIANLNAPGQIVISGDKSAIDRALARAREYGAKRAIRLAVSIAAHSELMRPAAVEFKNVVDSTPIAESRVPIVSNITAQPLQNADAIRAEMIAQLTSPVQWVKSIDYVRTHGTGVFIEIGPKDVLVGLIRRIAPDATAISLGSVSAIRSLREGALA